MILALAAAAAVAAASPCPDVVTAEAFVCRAIRDSADGKSEAAAQSFEQAALALDAGNPQSAKLWAAAGNMWIAANQPGKAAAALDKALAQPGLDGPQRGEALLDRARAAEAQNDLKTSRARLNEAASLVAQDPFYWYFSAAVAIREEDKATAETAINRALALAPADPTVLFEAGHVAQFTGDNVGARQYWERAIERDPHGPIGKAAREALVLLPAPLTVKNEPAANPPKN